MEGLGDGLRQFGCENERMKNVNCSTRLRAPMCVAAVLSLLAISTSAWTQNAEHATVLRGLKGIELGMTKDLALKAAEEFTLGTKFTCRQIPNSAEESCTSAAVPAAAHSTFGRAPVHYVAFTLDAQRVSEIRLHVGDERNPVPDASLGELGETLSAAVGSNPGIFANQSSDVILRWVGRQSELWLMSEWAKPQGVNLTVVLRLPQRTPEAFRQRTRNQRRFLDDL